MTRGPRGLCPLQALPSPGLRELLRLVERRDAFVETQIRRHEVGARGGLRGHRGRGDPGDSGVTQDSARRLSQECGGCQESHRGQGAPRSLGGPGGVTGGPWCWEGHGVGHRGVGGH